MKSKFTFIDLFAGIGGTRIGFERAGGRCILTSEIDDKALKTYKLNFKNEKDHLFVNDVKDVKKIKQYDVLVAGFPCQPYSIAGLRKGLTDERGMVFKEIIRLLKTTKPKAFLLENVKGITNHENGETFKYLLSLLKEAGYHTKFATLNSMSHGNVPQNRERVFIVGFREKNKINKFEFPDKVKLERKVKDLLTSSKVEDKYYYSNRFPMYPEVKKGIKKEYVIYQWRRVYIRENKSNVSPTLTANMGSGGHNVPLVKIKGKIRKLTPRECARFQGFPDSYKIEGISDANLYHQFGNSVTVPLIERIAKNIATLI